MKATQLTLVSRTKYELTIIGMSKIKENRRNKKNPMSGPIDAETLAPPYDDDVLAEPMVMVSIQAKIEPRAVHFFHSVLFFIPMVVAMMAISDNHPGYISIPDTLALDDALTPPPDAEPVAVHHGKNRNTSRQARVTY